MDTHKPLPSSTSASSDRGSFRDDPPKNNDQQSEMGTSGAVTPSSPPAHPLTPADQLAALPDAVNLQLSEILGTLPLLRLSESANGFSAAYGGRVLDMTLFRRGNSFSQSLLNFLRRQDRLKTLKLKSPELLRCFTTVLGERSFYFLETLRYYSLKALLRQADMSNLSSA
jgi:hypothetical protein